MKRRKFLTHQEERDLAVRNIAGDERALHALVLAHTPLAERMARKHCKGADLEEMMQEAFVGLLQAAKRFDPSREIRFATYAEHWIRASLFDAIITSDLIKGPRTRDGKSERLRGVIRGVAISIETPIREEGDTGNLTLGDTLVSNESLPDEIVQRSLDLANASDAIAAALADLDPRARDVIVRRHLTDEPETLADVSFVHSISRERVRQIEMKAMEKISRAVWRTGRHVKAAVQT